MMLPEEKPLLSLPMDPGWLDPADGAGLEPLPAGAELHGRYHILEVAGRGGMSTVYEAVHQDLGKRVAIKEMTVPGGSESQREEAVHRFRQEARTLARLHYPHIPDVIDFFAQGEYCYLVMEYVEGETLLERANRTGERLEEEEVLRWGIQLCDVLAYLHGQDPPVIFRDLKPSNIMVDREGQLKLIDFGIARLLQDLEENDSLGTEGFSPPEQRQGQRLDPRSDIYSLGACLHFFLSRRSPAETPFHFPLLRKINPSISEPTARVVERCVSQEPAERYPSAVAVRRALLAAVQDPPTTNLAVQKGNLLAASPGAGRRLWWKQYPWLTRDLPWRYYTPVLLSLAVLVVFAAITEPFLFLLGLFLLVISCAYIAVLLKKEMEE